MSQDDADDKKGEYENADAHKNQGGHGLTGFFPGRHSHFLRRGPGNYIMGRSKEGLRSIFPAFF